MHKPKIIFFDIDGTLIDMEKKQVTPRMLDTLHKLQANGIRLAIATGRSPMTVPLKDFPGVQFDTLLTFNGSYCYDKEQVLYASPIPTEDFAPSVRMPPYWAAPCALLPKSVWLPTALIRTLPIILPLQRIPLPSPRTSTQWPKEPYIRS